MTMENSAVDSARTTVTRSLEKDPRAKALYSALPYFTAVIICGALLARIYRLFTVDLRVPFGWVSDNSFNQAMVKNFVEGHHYYINPLLGAPGYQELYDFPLPQWTHLIILSVVGLFTRNSGLAINCFYLLGYALSAVTCLYAFRRIGVSTGLAVAGAVLFAFTPFHLMRAEGHLIFSAYYLVPLICMVAVWLSTGHELFKVGRRRQNLSSFVIAGDGVISLVVCILLGWDNPYYAFFGAGLVIIGGALGLLRARNRQAAMAAAVLLIVLIGSLGVGLLPNAYYFHRHGRASVAARYPFESETLGLTIIQLLAPVTNHRVPALAAWKEYYNSHAILVNENDTASLGLIGALGFVSLLAYLLLRHRDPTLYSLSILNLFATLLGTVGGLGAIVGFVVSPQLRAFNRISIYISFFSIAAVLVILDRFVLARAIVWQGSLGLVVLPLTLLLIGIPDQVPRHNLVNRNDVEKRFWQDARFMNEIEALVPPEGMIFQMPYDPFPESPPVHKMTDYDELKGYLHSSSLRWSYGSMRGRPTDKWLAATSAQPVGDMLLTIVTAGFAGIYIDRYGYEDHAATLEAQLRALLGKDPIVGEDGRLSFFLLDSVAIRVLKHQLEPENRAKLVELLEPLSAEIGSGCWPKEELDSRTWHWCGTRGEVVMNNPSKLERKIEIEGTLVTNSPSPSSLSIEGPETHTQVQVNDKGTAWKAEIPLTPGISIFHLWCACKRVISPNDPRELFFRIEDFRYWEVANK